MKSKNKKAIGIMLAVLIAISVLTVAIPGIASEPSNTKVTVDISSASRAKSILQIENVKSDLADAQKKLSTDLLQLVNSSFLPQGQNRETLEMEMKRLGQFRPASFVSPASDGRVADDLVYVYVYLKPLAGTPTIEPYVWEVTNRDEGNHLAVAWVEVKDLETLASLEAVRTIRTVMPPLVRTGSVTTEGDAIHRTSDVRATYSQSGSGVKVGIISDGVDNRASAQSSGDLPASLIVLSNTQGGDEGTAMLEIVHDMVPDADLYFHDCGANTVAFNNAIDALVTDGCDVICDDIGWITQPFFEDGIIASHLTSVLASNDIIYASSAGNAGQRHYQGGYYDSGEDITGIGEYWDLHDFSRGSEPVYKYLYVNIPNNGEVIVALQWNDKFGSSGNDYDLFLFDTADWSILAHSTYTQNGNDDPLEYFSYTNTVGSTIIAEIDVGNYNGAAATKTLEVFIYPSSGAWVYLDNINPVDSIFGHAAVPDAIAVGAIAASDPGNDDIEPFSSQGPVTISYPSPVSRSKPDLCGIDGVTVTGAGGFSSPFYGTSAAAPHIAAIAAQLWGAFPAKTGDEIRTTLYSSALDLGSAGYDNVFGYGRADALDAFVAIVPPTIIASNPPSPVSDVEGASRTFDLTTDQTVTVNWLINGTTVQTNTSVTSASYTNASARLGIWNVSAIANNPNGTAMQTWIWVVTPISQPDIWVYPTSFELTLSQNTSEDYTLMIGNNGNATLTYNITDNSSWLDENLKSGSVEPSSYDNIAVSISTTGLSTGDYHADINITSNDPDESLITVPVHLTVKPVALIFDTEQPKNPYPSIFGTHNGTITPNMTIYNVSRLYTYPCAGTGGHSESIAFYNSTTEAEIANGTWNGYQGAGDYHCIELNVPITLQKNETYNYTIRTGSYPQIFHTDALQTANGWINCTKFTDANGKEYTDWIPAIRLE